MVSITEASLTTATTTLAEVQTQLLSIPVGHSLKSDPKALRICHSLCIDTALIYRHPRGRPLKPGLAWLTKKWCDRGIQTRGEGGHDPEEVARAPLSCFDSKSKTAPDSASSRPTMKTFWSA